jgi:paraquat-inducible protein B
VKKTIALWDRMESALGDPDAPRSGPHGQNSTLRRKLQPITYGDLLILVRHHGLRVGSRGGSARSSTSSASSSARRDARAQLACSSRRRRVAVRTAPQHQRRSRAGGTEAGGVHRLTGAGVEARIVFTPSTRGRAATLRARGLSIAVTAGLRENTIVSVLLTSSPRSRAAKELAAEGIRIPVFIELDNDKLSNLGASGQNLNNPQTVKDLIAAGLRAQLATQSLLTGLLFVQLNFYHDMPASFAMPEGFKPQEIPAIPTNLERVQSAAEDLIRKLQTADVARMVTSAADVLNGINRLVSSSSLHQSVDALPKTVTDLDDTITSFHRMVSDLNAKKGPLLDSLKVTVDKGHETLEQARITLASMDRALAPASPLATSVRAALQDVSEAARAVRLLADYLERNPGAIVRGRDVSQK